MNDYRTQKILLTGNIKPEVEDYLLWQCYQANNLYNTTLWHIRQSHFETCPMYEYFDKNDCYRRSFLARIVKASYANLCKLLKNSQHYQLIGGQQAQQCIKSVIEAITSYNKLIRAWWHGELSDKPRIPGYRKSGGIYQLSYPNQAVRYNFNYGVCKLAISKENKSRLLEDEIIIPCGHGFSSEDIAEVRIVPNNGNLWAEYVYKTKRRKANNLDYSQGIGIDPGVSNWLTIASSYGKSFIICGKKVKSINQRYNKTVANYKKGKSDFYWDDYLSELTHKRNAIMRDVANKAARMVINYCLAHGIGNIVFGWGQEVKNQSNLGKRNNQNFVQIPTSRLKKRIQELAESVGIIFTETEEAYTSKSDFFSSDLLPKYGEKPNGYKFSGTRITRGAYRTAKGLLVCADALGAINILKKVAIQLGISLAEVGRQALTLPKRYNLSDMKKLYRKRCEAMAFSLV